jgi:hypothetical protein
VINEIEVKANELLGSATAVSPYKISRVLTSMLKRTVQGPMIYSYRNKKFGFKSYKNDLDKWTVDRDEAVRFIVSFVERNTEKSEG